MDFKTSSRVGVKRMNDKKTSLQRDGIVVRESTSQNQSESNAQVIVWENSEIYLLNADGSRRRLNIELKSENVWSQIVKKIKGRDE